MKPAQFAFDSSTHRPPGIVSNRNRSRATKACSECRKRRTRCFKPNEDVDCDSCRSNGRLCKVRDFDERQRKLKKADREALESENAALKRKLAVLGMSAHDCAPSSSTTPPVATVSSPLSNHQASAASRLPGETPQTTTSSSSWQHEGDPRAAPASTHHGSSYAPVPKALGTGSFDERPAIPSMRLPFGQEKKDAEASWCRYFGFTTDPHLRSDISQRTRGTLDLQNERARSMLASLDEATKAYLLDKFWTSFNSVFVLVHRRAFEKDRDQDGDQQGRLGFYSGWLHIAMLAIAFRYADPQVYHVGDLASSAAESKLHLWTRELAQLELVSPGTIPSIQALFILGDLERGMDDNRSGWLYAGMAIRLCFDLGLNREPTKSDRLGLAYEVRRMLMVAAVLIDRYWGLYLGRPTAIKLADLTIPNITDMPLFQCLPWADRDTEKIEIYEKHFLLMGIAARFTDPGYSATDFLVAASIDQDLKAWKDNLGNYSRWDQGRMANCLPSYYLLHQLFHTLYCFLYRPFLSGVRSGLDVPEGGFSAQMMQKTALQECHYHAVQICKLFSVYEERDGIQCLFVTGIQHVTTAALALVDSIPHIAPRERKEAIDTLQRLANGLHDKARTYAPAKHMAKILQQHIRGFRSRAKAATAKDAALEGSLAAAQGRPGSGASPPGAPEHEEMRGADGHQRLAAPAAAAAAAAAPQYPPAAVRDAHAAVADLRKQGSTMTAAAAAGDSLADAHPLEHLDWGFIRKDEDLMLGDIAQQLAWCNDAFVAGVGF